MARSGPIQECGAFAAHPHNREARASGGTIRRPSARRCKWRASSTPVRHCLRHVIDVSGDRVSNKGGDPQAQHLHLRAANITVNAIAIETDTTDLTAYFFENLITGRGAFVVSANGFAYYPEQIRRKLQRETTRRLTDLSK